MKTLRSSSEEISTLVDATSGAVLHVRVLRPGNRPLGSGSGVLLDDNGYALTNSHVVAGAVGIEVEVRR